MDRKLLEETNLQINKELESAYIYLALSAKCELLNLRGFANWLKVQAQEEVEHAMKLYQHLIDRNEKVELEAIKKPNVQASTPVEIFSAAYVHEQYITKSIHQLQDTAEQAKDRGIASLLDWFAQEQIEEEKTTLEIVNRLKIAKDDGSAILLLDKQLGKRKDEE